MNKCYGLDGVRRDCDVANKILHYICFIESDIITRCSIFDSYSKICVSGYACNVLEIMGHICTIKTYSKSYTPKYIYVANTSTSVEGNSYVMLLNKALSMTNQEPIFVLIKYVIIVSLLVVDPNIFLILDITFHTLSVSLILDLILHYI